MVSQNQYVYGLIIINKLIIHCIMCIQIMFGRLYWYLISMADSEQGLSAILNNFLKAKGFQESKWLAIDKSEC